MKKIFILFAFLTTTLGINAQEFALVDMEYILTNIPAYERGNEQLAQVSKKWQAEVEALSTEAQTKYIELSERGGVPVGRAEEVQAGCHYAERAICRSTETEIFRS